MSYLEFAAVLNARRQSEIQTVFPKISATEVHTVLNH